MSDSLLDLGTTPIFPSDPDWASQPAITESTGREVIQYGKGCAKYRILTHDINYSFTLNFFNISKLYEYTLIKFFHDRKGMLERFWIPFPASTFNLSADIAATTHCTIIDTYFADVYQGYERIYIVNLAGDKISRKISSMSGRTQINVSSAFPATLISNISLFGRILLCRFDQDELSFTHEATDKSICSIKFCELSKEYSLV
jgi:hypothetical protein